MDLSLILNISTEKAVKSEKKLSQEREFEELFTKYTSLVPSQLITELAKKHQLDRENVRIWFHNRRTKERQSLLRKYKSSKLKLKSALNTKFKLSNGDAFVYYAHLQNECKKLLATVQVFHEGEFMTMA